MKVANCCQSCKSTLTKRADSHMGRAVEAAEAAELVEAAGQSGVGTKAGSAARLWRTASASYSNICRS
jgi:hypothetical protein